MTVLKNVPSILTPDLLRCLALMGHGDELVLADANFPSHSMSRSTALGEALRFDGVGVPELLEAVLSLLPLDDPGIGRGDGEVAVMAMMDEHVKMGWKEPEVWATYRAIAEKAEGRNVELQEVERFAFYERAKKAFAVVATGETALYGNIIVKKGIIGKANK
ncbi:RbsD-like domain-containing protein [Hyaloraphidium curvatum]|nr:RbsD-like domain-containing protein [Hyaloraphidium curvatum]